MTNSPLLSGKLLVKKSPIHGYGVFANQDLQPGEIIEECYTLCVDTDENVLANYVFGSADKHVLPLGYGAIYNHSDQPNAECLLDLERSLTTFRATRFIKAQEEVCIFYSPKWFNVRNMKHKKFSLRFNIRRLLSSMKMLMRFAIVLGAFVALMVLMKNYSS